MMTKVISCKNRASEPAFKKLLKRYQYAILIIWFFIKHTKNAIESKKPGSISGIPILGQEDRQRMRGECRGCGVREKQRRKENDRLMEKCRGQREEKDGSLPLWCVGWNQPVNNRWRWPCDKRTGRAEGTWTPTAGAFYSIRRCCMKHVPLDPGSLWYAVVSTGGYN